MFVALYRLAGYESNLEVMQLLLDKGADVDAQN